jgi:exodeoxyribonuclease VII large subunit
VLKKQSLALKPSQQLAIWKQKLAALSKSIQTAVLQKHASNKKIFDVNTWRKSIDLRILDQISQKKQKLGRLSSHLQAIDPANLLKKGYCILFQEKKESVILSSRELNEQQKVRLQLHDGIAHLTVDGIES